MRNPFFEHEIWEEALYKEYIEEYPEHTAEDEKWISFEEYKENYLQKEEDTWAALQYDQWLESREDSYDIG